jgi:transcriptional regulator with XRE-family HTH domain
VKNRNRHWLAQYGRHLRRIRKRRGVTIEALSEAVQISSKFLGEVELAKKTPSLETMGKLADYFHISIGDFFDLEESRIHQVMQRVEEVLRVQ